jgi:hypothetical protein
MNQSPWVDERGSDMVFSGYLTVVFVVCGSSPDLISGCRKELSVSGIDRINFYISLVALYVAILFLVESFAFLETFRYCSLACVIAGDEFEACLRRQEGLWGGRLITEPIRDACAITDRLDLFLGKATMANVLNCLLRLLRAVVHGKDGCRHGVTLS